MSPISYAGKQRKSGNARFIYAIAIDLDGINSEKNLEVLFKQIERVDYLLENEVYLGLPAPSYFSFKWNWLAFILCFRKAYSSF